MDDLLCKAFDEVYEHEFDKYKVKKFHIFSLRHRRKMKELFRQLEVKEEDKNVSQGYRLHAKKKRPALLIVAIIFSILLSVTAAAYAVYSFGFKKQPDHTIVFSENIEKSPSKIECLYVISPLPDGYTKKENSKGHIYADVRYSNEEKYFILTQKVKKKYICRYNTEGYEIEKLDINGCDGFFVKFKDDNFLVWDNGDYVLELYGTLDKNELVELAKNVKAQEIEK